MLCLCAQKLGIDVRLIKFKPWHKGRHVKRFGDGGQGMGKEEEEGHHGGGGSRDGGWLGEEKARKRSPEGYRKWRMEVESVKGTVEEWGGAARARTQHCRKSGFKNPKECWRASERVFERRRLTRKGGFSPKTRRRR